METDLLTETQHLFEVAGVAIPEISRDTGLKQRWLHRLFKGDYQDPGVRKIEKLHRYLSARVPNKAA